MAKFFKCSKCPSFVVKLNEGGCNPSCCGEPMVELNANTVDAAKEKHVPVVKIEGNCVEVRVGDVPHPMLEAHWIGYIALETSRGLLIHELHPGEEPVTKFALAEGEKAIAAYEYCNLHGLWKVEL